MNPRKASKMMRKMGITQKEIDANEVIIINTDKELIIANNNCWVLKKSYLSTMYIPTM